jgi:cytochrome oxidase Cu insertion factor (SCO1/SenC/PrrC family)
LKKNKLLLKLAILLALTTAGGNIAMGAQTPAPSMKDQMKSMKESAKAPGVTNSSPAPMGGTYFSVPVPKNVLATNLFGTDGKAINLNGYKGKFVVVAPFLTSCQEICPMTSANMMLIANAINRAKMGDMAKVLEVSVDSERDSASRLKAYQNQFGDSSWTIAGGTTANLKAFWKFFGVMATKAPYSASDLKGLPVDWQTGKKNTYDVTHTDEVAIISPDQKWVWLDLGSPKLGKGSLPAKLKAFLDDAGIANLSKPEEPTWAVESVTSALSHLMGMKINS